MHMALQYLVSRHTSGSVMSISLEMVWSSASMGVLAVAWIGTEGLSNNVVTYATYFSVPNYEYPSSLRLILAVED